MRTRKAFTFIELIVTLAIIMLLAALIMPVFARTRESARRTNCASNLKQLGAALQLYALDYNGKLPPQPRSSEWMGQLMPYCKNNGIFSCPSESTETKREFGVYPNAPASWLDPSEAAPVGAQRGNASSYQYRGGLMNDAAGDEPLARDWDPWHLNSVNVLFLDGRAESQNASGPISLARGERPTTP